MEIELPFFFESEDIRVEIGLKGLHIEVEDFIDCYRTYWKPRYKP